MRRWTVAMVVGAAAGLAIAACGDGSTGPSKNDATGHWSGDYERGSVAFTLVAAGQSAASQRPGDEAVRATDGQFISTFSAGPLLVLGTHHAHPTDSLDLTLDSAPGGPVRIRCHLDSGERCVGTIDVERTTADSTPIDALPITISR